MVTVCLFWLRLAVFRFLFKSDHSLWAKWSKLGPCDQFWPRSSSAFAWSGFWQEYLFWPIKFKYKTSSQLSTISFCLYPFSHDTSFFAICMDFAHRYISIRRIVYVYILIYKCIPYFKKIRGEKFIQAAIQWKFCQFNLRIRAEHIRACPRFVHYNQRNRPCRHWRQSATDGFLENVKIGEFRCCLGD